jgi:hypothetical protein
MLKRRLKLLGKILLALVVLFVAFLLFERFCGQYSLALFKRRLAAKGESLEVHKLIVPPLADADNGASEILGVKPSFTEGKAIPRNYPPKMRLMATGRALVGFREDYWVDEKITNTWEEVSSDLATNRQALEQLRAALAKPGFDFKLDHSHGFEMDFTHIPPTKSYSQWLGAAVQNSLRNGEYQVALEDLLAAIRIPRVLENDRILISELVRAAISSINLGTTWEALQADVWTEEQLARIQAAWEKNTFATNMVRSLRVERADGDTYFERFRKSNDETYQYMFPIWLQSLTGDEDVDPGHWWQSEFVRKQIYCRIWRIAWLDQDEKFYLEGIQRLVGDHSTGAEKAARPGEEYWFGLGKAPRQNFYDNWRFGMSAQSLGSLSRSTVKSDRAETQRSIVLSAIALKRYSLRHGNYPESLDALVPEFLSAVPTDYMDGKPVKYRRNEDGSFTLYSVGEDGKDDGGDVSLPADKPNARQLWDRKDFVWPAPATPEEVEEYRRKAGKD